MRRLPAAAIAWMTATAVTAAQAQAPEPNGAADAGAAPVGVPPDPSGEPAAPPERDTPRSIRTLLVVDDPDGRTMTRQLTLSAAMLYASMGRKADEIGLHASAKPAVQLPPVAIGNGETFARIREALTGMGKPEAAPFDAVGRFVLQSFGAPRPGVADAVVVLAHAPGGEPYVPKLPGDLGAKLAARRVPVFVVAFGQKAEPEAYGSLVQPTGGEGFRIQSGADLKKAFTEIYARLQRGETLPVVGDRLVVDANVAQATVVVPKQTGQEKVELVTPGDRVLSAKVKHPGVDWTSFAEFDLVRLDHPEVGTWRIRQPSAVGGAVGHVNASQLELEATVGPRAAMVGAPFWVEAHLEQDGRVLDSYAALKQLLIEAEVREPSGRMRSVRLEPGGHGSFRAEIPAETAGYHEIRLTAFSPGIQRERRLTHLVHPPCFAGRFDAQKGEVVVEMRSTCPRFVELFGDVVVEREGEQVAVARFERSGRELRANPPRPRLGQRHELRIELRGRTSDDQDVRSGAGGPFVDAARKATPLDHLLAVLERLAILNVPVIVGLLGLVAVRQARRGGRAGEAAMKEKDR